MGTQDVTKHGGSAYNLEMAQSELYGPPEASYGGGLGGPAKSTTAASGAGTGAGTVV